MSELLEERPTYGVVNDDQTAEWCMEQIRNANEEKKRWKDFYAERYQSVCDTCDRTIADMEAALRFYFDTVPHKVTKTQENYALPSGKLVIKQQEPEYTRDDATIIQWLEENGGQKYIKIKKELDWSSLKGTLTIMGETVADEEGNILPGINPTEVCGMSPVSVGHADGLVLRFADDSWVQLRPSRTEPLVRARAESHDEVLAEELGEQACRAALARLPGRVRVS